MYKRLMFLISLVCLLGLATGAYAERLGLMDDANDLLEQELEGKDPDEHDLWVPVGDTHTVGPASSETYDEMWIAGTLIVQGTLTLTGDERSTCSGPGATIIVDGGVVDCQSRFNMGKDDIEPPDSYLYILNGGSFTQGCCGNDWGDGLKFPDDDGGENRIYLVNGTLQSHRIELRGERDAMMYIGCQGHLILDSPDMGDDRENPNDWLSNGYLHADYGCTTLDITYNGPDCEVECQPDVTGKAWCPTPSDGADEQSVNLDCSWLPGSGMVNPGFDVHHVYFGTSPGSLAWIVDLTLGTETFKPSDYASLSVGPWYYWRVDEEILFGAYTTGDVWSFQTGCEPIPGDVNGDCVVDMMDYALLAGDWRDSMMFPDDF
jgi:hypothetical protein